MSFEQGDAQVHAFPDCTFDVAVSSFGAMFFADPVAAFANIGRSLSGRGRLAVVAWREFEANQWVGTIRDALSLGRPLPTPPAGMPGPFGLADRRRTERVLADAGFVGMDIQPLAKRGGQVYGRWRSLRRRRVPRRVRSTRRISPPLSFPGMVAVVVFSATLSASEFIYALAFVSQTSQKTISVGVPTELVRGDVFFWQSLQAATLLVAIPIASCSTPS